MKLFDITLKPEFFYLGELKEAKFIGHNYFPMDDIRNGTKEEIEKYYALLLFEKEIKKYNSYYELLRFFASYSIIPVVLRNVGSKQDQNIKVKFSFNKKIEVLKSDDFIKPKKEIIEEFTGYDGYIHLLFSHDSDSKINDYQYAHLVKEHYLQIAYEPNTKTLKKDFKNYIEALFDYKHYEENESTVLIFEFDQLNPKENMAFPCFLMVQAEETFEISYEFTSVNLTEVAKGILTYEI